MSHARLLLLAAAATALAACADRQPVASDVALPPRAGTLACRVEVRARTLRCETAPEAYGFRAAVVGGQNLYVRVASSGVTYDSASAILAADVTVQNLLFYPLGTADGQTADAEGIRVFFHDGPRVSEGSGTVQVENADGVGTFTGAGQPFFRYPGPLAPTATSPAKRWRFRLDPGVIRFDFLLYLDVRVPPVLVIDEVMAASLTADEGAGEWIEIYNRGLEPVNLQGWTLASRGDAGHTITASLVVPRFGYVVLGGSVDPAANGGAGVDYAYSGISLANDTSDWLVLHQPGGVTADSLRWGAAAGEAAEPPLAGVSRGLESPVADNLFLGGASSPWSRGAALYGALGQRGTPGGRNLLPLDARFLAVGDEHACATDGGGAVWCWGANDSAQVSSAPLAYSPRAVAAPRRAGVTAGALALLGRSSCVLSSDGRPFCWGAGFNGLPTVGTRAGAGEPPNLPPGSFTLLGGRAAVHSFSPALGWYGWSWRSLAEPLDGRGLPAGLVEQIAASPGYSPDGSSLASHACVLVEGGVYCRGANQNGELGDTTCHCVVTDSFRVVQLPPARYSAVAVTQFASCALDEGGQAWCWGRNFDGELGSGSPLAGSPVPTAVAQPAGVRFASLGSGGSWQLCALTGTGQAYCWGRSAGDPERVPVPVAQPPGLRFASIASGPYFTCALEAGTGQPFCWGMNNAGQLGDGSATPRVTPVAAGR